MMSRGWILKIRRDRMSCLSSLVLSRWRFWLLFWLGVSRLSCSDCFMGLSGVSSGVRIVIAIRRIRKLRFVYVFGWRWNDWF